MQVKDGCVGCSGARHTRCKDVRLTLQMVGHVPPVGVQLWRPMSRTTSGSCREDCISGPNPVWHYSDRDISQGPGPGLPIFRPRFPRARILLLVEVRMRSSLGAPARSTFVSSFGGNASRNTPPRRFGHARREQAVAAEADQQSGRLPVRIESLGDQRRFLSRWEPLSSRTWWAMSARRAR